MSELETVYLHNGIVMDEDGEQVHRQSKQFFSADEAQEWADKEELGINVVNGKRVGDKIVTSNVQSIPCDCQHCRELRGKFPEKSAQQLHDERHMRTGTVIADCERAVDYAALRKEICDTASAAINESREKKFSASLKIIHTGFGDLLDAAIRRAAESAAREVIRSMAHSCTPSFLQSRVEVIERHVRQELGL